MTPRSRTQSNIKNSSRSTKYQPNYTLVLVVFFFLLFGLLMIFSASAVIAFIYQEGDTFFFFKRQIVWIILGIIAGYVFYRIPIYKLRKISVWILAGTFFLMIYLIPEALFNVKLPFIDTINGATRWINLGFFSLQPSEIAKLAVVLFSASWFTLSDQKKRDIEKFLKSKEKSEIYHAFLVILYKYFIFIIMAFLVALVLIQKDLDTIVIIVLIFISMFYVSGKGKFHNLYTTLLLILSGIVGTAAMLIETYRRSRFYAFLQILFYGEPSNTSKRGESFQVWNGLIALGLGGVLGVGYGQSRQKLFFLQEAAYTDSIFTIIGEEFGLVGTLAVILGFLAILSIGLKIAKQAPNKYASLIAVGVTSWITIQAFLNMAANLALIPFGGMPLPFLTYGGTNTIMVLVGIGILLNISKTKVETR